MSSSADLHVAFCSREAATLACKRWHYSGQIPVGKLVNVGAWEAGRFIGAVVFSLGANRNAHKLFGVSFNECVELVRVALDRHATPTSRIVALALRTLRRKTPAVRVVFSYADPDAGHVGTLYQAGGWTYTGSSFAAARFVTREGKTIHHRMLAMAGRDVAVFGRNAKAVNKESCVRVPVPPKYRYALAFDAASRARLAALAKPYPKRARPIGSVEHPSTLGGEAPTRALHSPDGAA